MRDSVHSLEEKKRSSAFQNCLSVVNPLTGPFTPIVRTVTFHRIDRVVISGPGLKAIDTHAEYRVGMITIQSDVGFRDLVYVLWVRAAGHYTASWRTRLRG